MEGTFTVTSRRTAATWPHFVLVRKDAWMDVEFWDKMFRSALDSTHARKYGDRYLKAKAATPEG